MIEPVSDDFNTASLNSQWNFIDSVGDSSYQLTGTNTSDAYLEMTVGGGVAHDMWKNNTNAVRVMQAADNSDFGLEVKFASQPNQQYQIQGILVEQDSDDWLRFDTYHDGNNFYVFAAATTNGSSKNQLKVAVPLGAASHLQVNRQGDTWTFLYSSDGNNWNTAGSFTHALTVTQVGTFAGNAGSNAPAFTAQVDYFFNSEAPIIPEDQQNPIPVANDDIASVNPENSVTIDALNNDSDGDGNLEPSTITIETQPTQGNATINADGTITYTHTGTGNGNDSFTYVVRDNDGNSSNVATVNVNIQENQAPVANNDTANLQPGQSLTIDVLGNDSDSDGSINPSSIIIDTHPTEGTASVNADGTITYTHTGTGNGNDSFTYTVADNQGKLSNTATVDLSIAEQSLAFNSDDFNTASLNSQWNFIDSVGDSSYQLTGTNTSDAYLEMTVGGGVAHDMWKNNTNAVRVMQGADNSDFGLEVKFASQPNQRYQIQGILVEQDSDNWLRFDTYHDGNNFYVFAAATTNDSSKNQLKVAVPLGAASHLQVNRQGDTWTFLYSSDGNNWNTAGSFTHALTVTQVGTFAGNAGSNAPAFTAQVDYFFNSEAPIIPEDQQNPIPVANDDIASVNPENSVTIDAPQ